MADNQLEANAALPSIAIFKHFQANWTERSKTEWLHHHVGQVGHEVWSLFQPRKWIVAQHAKVATSWVVPVGFMQTVVWPYAVWDNLLFCCKKHFCLTHENTKKESWFHNFHLSYYRMRQCVQLQYFKIFFLPQRVRTPFGVPLKTGYLCGDVLYYLLHFYIIVCINQGRRYRDKRR